MKKVAIVINNAFSYAGTENVCNFMTDCMGDIASIEVLSLEGGGEPFYPFDNVSKIISYQNEKNPIFSVRRKIIETGYDTVFVVGMGKLSFLLRCIFFGCYSLKQKTKFIACEHIAFDSFSLIIKILKIYSLRWYNTVVVLTDKDKSKLKSFNINAIKINNPVKYNYHVKSERFYSALAVGRLNNQKGFDKLISLWASFSVRNEKWILNIAGDGELLEDLSNQVSKLNIENSVKFLGRVSDLDSLYKQSDVLLMTSRYEGLPMVLLEAKSWSLPVIAYDCPTGPGEIIRNNIDGFLIENDNKEDFLKKLQNLADSDDVLFKLSTGSKNTFKEFDAEEIKNNWIGLL